MFMWAWPPSAESAMLLPPRAVQSCSGKRFAEIYDKKVRPCEEKYNTDRMFRDETSKESGSLRFHLRYGSSKA